MRNAYPYLLRSKYGIFHFRIVVPQPLRSAVGLREIRRSLHTRDLKAALARSGELLRQAETLFEEAVGNSPIANRTLECSWRPRKRAVAKREGVEGGAVSSPLLSAVFAEFAERQRLEGVSEKTISDKRATVDTLVWIVGDRPISTIGRVEVQCFREVMLQLPPGFNRQRHLPVSQVIGSATRTLSVTTYNNYVKYLSTLFVHAIREGCCTGNPFANQKIRQRQKASAQRARYSHQELQTLFGSSIYTRRYDGPSWRFWLPLMALYTGARLNELCQLYLDDLVLVDGIDCIHVRATRPDQKIKNLASERLIPIHSELRRLGLLTYVDELRQAGQQRLFPELRHNARNGYGHSASKWFARWRAQLGLGCEGERKDFHSFRHTVADELKQQGLAESQIAALLGHQSGGITFGRYGKDYRPGVLVPVVEALKINARPLASVSVT